MKRFLQKKAFIVWAMLFFMTLTVLVPKIYGEENAESSTSDEANRKKVVYLTFDDGPSPNNTRKIIDVLNKEGVKATFFLIGQEAENRPHIVRDLVDNGMTVLPHSYSHKTNYIYKSSSNYISDYEKCKEVLEHIVRGPLPNYMRMPTGSYTPCCNKWVMQDIIKGLRSKDVSYIDWNVSTDDSLGKNVPVENLKNKFIKQAKDKDFIVVLMHDSYYCGTTVTYLPEMIKYLKDNGYEFKTINDMTPEDEAYMKDHRLINKTKKVK